MTLDTWPKWYAALTGPRAEQEASVNLRRAGYWVFYPHVRENVRKKRQGGGVKLLVGVIRPLFPRYVFFALRSPAENFQAAEEAKGVSAVVRLRYSKIPLQIPNKVVDLIMDWADKDGMVPTATALHWFRGKVGDSVEVKDGPLDGLITCIASVDALEASDEISVWVKMLGAEHKVAVPVASVKLVEVRA
jgi:transcription antitermination factor NusG